MDRPRTLAELVALYRADFALFHRSLRSLEGLDLFVAAFGDAPPETLDAQCLDAWRRRRRADGIAVTTLERNLAALSGALRFAVDRGWLEQNPVRALRPLPVRESQRARFLAPAEEARMRAALVARDQRYGGAASTNVPAFADALTPAVLLSLNTGLRRGELLTLY